MGVTGGSAPSSIHQNLMFYNFWLAISDSICWVTPGVCMASEDPGVSWPDLCRWPYSCNLWHQWLSKSFKHQKIVNVYFKFLTLKVPGSHLVATRNKIGPWGPELIWQLATKYKMSRHQRHLQYVIIYTMTNEGGVSIFGIYVSQKSAKCNFF